MLFRDGEFYRLQSHEGYSADYATQFVGWDGMYQNTALSMNLSADDQYTEWALIESQNVNSSSIALYDAQKTLYSLLLTADSLGIATENFGEIYKDENSTVQTLNEAATQLQMAINLNNYNGLWDNASLDNPIDITATFVQNADFDLSAEGWTLANGASYHSAVDVYTNNDSTLTRLGSTTDESGNPARLNYFVESNGTASMSVSQRISMLPPGLYQLRVNAVATNGGKGASGVEMYANYASRVANVTASAIRNLTTAESPENFNVYFFQERDFAPEIGVRASSSDATWIAADHFRLFYLGTENPDFRFNATFWGQDSLSVVSTAALHEGDAITVPNAPDVEGYTFVEWDQEIPATMPPYDLDIRAIYTVNQYKISFLVDGDTIDSQIYDYGTVYAVPEVTVPAGHSFSGWIGMPDTETMPARDVVVTASFIKGAYTVSYYIDGELYKVVGYESGDTIAVEPDAVREGYTFSGWPKLPEVIVDQNYEVSGSFTVNYYKLTFVCRGEVVREDSIAYGTPIVAPSVQAGLTEYHAGWNPALPATMPAENLVLDAVFQTLDPTPEAEGVFVTEGNLQTLLADSIAAGTVSTEDLTIRGTINNEDINYLQTLPVKQLDLTDCNIVSGVGFTSYRVPVASAAQTAAATAADCQYQYLVNGQTVTAAEYQAAAANITTDTNFTIAVVNFITDAVVSSCSFILRPMTASEAADGIVPPITINVNGVVTSGNTIIIPTVTTNPTTGDIIAGQGEPVSIEAEYDDSDIMRNVVVKELFVNMPQLEEISLPTSTVGVEAGAFANLSNLLVIEWNGTAPVSAEAFGSVDTYGNLLVFAAEGTDVTFAGNVIVGNTAQSITLRDGAPFRNPRAFQAEYISFTKSFVKSTAPGVAGGWETIVLPFDVKRIERTEDHTQLKPFGGEAGPYLYFWLAQMDQQIGFVSADSIRANVPYIISMPNSDYYTPTFNISGEITFSAEQVTVRPTTEAQRVEGSAATFVPSYEGQAAAQDVFVLNNDSYNAANVDYLPGAIFVRSSRDANPFEAFLSSEGHGVKGQFITFAEANAIMAVTSDQLMNGRTNANGPVYDLSGRRMVNGQCLMFNGVYIQNGKKIVVR